MQIIPFTTRQTDIRVIKSEIGNVVPIVDIARAIDYEANKVRELVERNFELFEGTSSTVTVSEVQNNRGTMAEQNRTMIALNNYGIVGLLMKLDYNRIKSQEKKDSIIRFQRWAMRTLGNKINKQRGSKGYISKDAYMTEVAWLPEDAGPWMDTKETGKRLNISYRTVEREIRSGRLTAYRHTSGKYAILETDFNNYIKGRNQ